ncbi:hypothetical protein UAJ10_02165 [Nitrospirillum sp. BR 11164]|uniref:hypothetical protein n=1 Tax=Nitrospirillum sp. BR 11164 TaxID=3104324 RepID=UPI002AFEE4E8|nr:hypothetical protein [Nitrospirillum sp. BR 11164]MEA1647824.1 hypothetical protein [Nitrospirillum sp. BR 11164]
MQTTVAFAASWVIVVFIAIMALIVLWKIWKGHIDFTGLLNEPGTPIDLGNGNAVAAVALAAGGGGGAPAPIAAPAPAPAVAPAPAAAPALAAVAGEQQQALPNGDAPPVQAPQPAQPAPTAPAPITVVVTPPPSTPGKASLSRLQFLLFTFVIAGLYLTLSLEADKFVDIPPQVLGLLGISGGSYVLAKGIQANADSKS